MKHEFLRTANLQQALKVAKTVWKRNGNMLTSINKKDVPADSEFKLELSAKGNYILFI